MTPASPKKANRLVHEKSPYLLQHAHNPVDWFPWDKEAFEQARKEDKPVFLSIGYSTCHWCHVMEKESFQDEEVARLLNDTFVCIKVDREERPDLDAVYMKACQVMSRSGGWPLTIFMTPDKIPFFAGTYFPKHNRFNQPGLLEMLPRLKILWKDHREQLLAPTSQIVQTLQKAQTTSFIKRLDLSQLEQAFNELCDQYDQTYGGFGQSPKFPATHDLFFLLRYWKRTGKTDALDMVEKTLRSMRSGGIFDHLGFGFHRYSTDQRWLLPHFEKMLYDQALLSLIFTEAYQATRKDLYKKTAEEILDYVERELISPEGGFYSAEDADSEGQEGKFYVWKESEIRQVLNKKEADLAVHVFGIAQDGNFKDESSQSLSGANILFNPLSQSQLAARTGYDPDRLEAEQESIRAKLFHHRKKRIHPFKDDKILADWNGLMIAAFARAARIFDSEHYRKIAERAAGFVQKNMTTKSGELLHSYRDKETSSSGFLDDYAFMTWGLIELYESTYKIAHLKSALKLTDLLIADFWDETHGGFFLNSIKSDEAFYRPKEYYDGPIPSGNSVAALNCLRLGRMTGRVKLEKTAELVFQAASSRIVRSPSSTTYLMAALDFAIGPSFEICVAGIPESKDTKKMLKALHFSFLPNKVVLLNPMNTPEKDLHDIAPFTRDQSMLNQKATAYVCQERSCLKPTNDIEEMLKLLSPSEKDKI